ncbi:hypothetical protein EUGRSUZ_C02412 [Eucalyptus grandis]|uniref:Uncharacterized protein n=2 Tax=Eucalyptus grandis TaxID=71139 RepID=A0ACC3LG27_EUCGR|nr:hypothetical protein EUGRSUZ_C02412 [Eucalyptus grandis]
MGAGAARLKQKRNWETRGKTEFEACSQRWGLLRWVLLAVQDGAGRWSCFGHWSSCSWMKKVVQGQQTGGTVD